MTFDSKAGKQRREQLRQLLNMAKTILAQPDDTSSVVDNANDIRLLVTQMLIEE